MKKYNPYYIQIIIILFATIYVAPVEAQYTREVVSLNDNWRFMKYETGHEDSLIYDVWPDVKEHNDSKDADSKPTEAVKVKSEVIVLKNWILPTANAFINDSAKHYKRPEGNPGGDFSYVQFNFDDKEWKQVSLPHDWAISEPFQTGWNSEVGGGMGRLPSHGVAWYRKKINIPAKDKEKSIYLYVEGAMSYAMVWFNGHLVGGWPYGYNSWQLDLTPYVKLGGDNQLAIRIDNPPASARWYPGGGIYRNVWLIKTNPVHVGQWGTFVKSTEVSKESATVEFELSINNDSEKDVKVDAQTKIFVIDENGSKNGDAVAIMNNENILVGEGHSIFIKGLVNIKNPRLWGPSPNQNPNRYVAVTNILDGDDIIDSYESRFGIRSVHFDSNKGLFVNGEHIRIQGVNQHHDLGALGAAFNVRAAERQLEILRDMGCNAIRLAHNPPAPELLELTDRMGFLVIDEIFDVWERKKTPLDFHLIFPDWYEADVRAFIRRDRNHPSVIMWSYGNEVGEQYTGEDGVKVSLRLHDIVKEEDPTRPATASMNFAKPEMPFPQVLDVISLNYQGEGIRDAEAYAHLKGIRTSPLYNAFHEKFPDKAIVSSETASALSTRGTYLFPVFDGVSAPVEDGSGGDPKSQFVSAYELYTAPFGASADKVFAAQDKSPYVVGEFVWSGWDYLGEPTPYYLARSSYSGIIDLAGFKKDRFYLYQSRWRPELPMVHILPHWNWSDRIGKIIPVHVFTSGDEVELFLNGQFLGRKRKGEFEYRLRWDSVSYEPGELKAIAYKNGEKWAEQTIRTTGEAKKLEIFADRTEISADGKDLSFITVKVTDNNGLVVPDAMNLIEFSIEGPGEIVATDNGNPSDMVPFSSLEREAFNGFVLVIIRSMAGKPGVISVVATAPELEGIKIEIKSK